MDDDVQKILSTASTLSADGAIEKEVFGMGMGRN